MSAVLVIGNFDGVHRGHLALVHRAIDEAGRSGSRVVAVTFDPHPAVVLRPDDVPPALQSLDERIEMLLAAGCDHVEVLTFDAELASLTAERFVAELLVDRLGAAVVVVGENFRFGSGAAGDIATLRALGIEHGFAVEAVPLVDIGDGIVSSSAIRALLAAGDLVAVERALGRPYRLSGEVVPGEGRGRTIGVPTANLAVPGGRALPGDGVYACWAVLEAGGHVPAVVNIGWRPTFGGTGRTVEAHLLTDEVPDLYGTTLQLLLVARIRGEQRFDGPESLVARIQEDIRAAGGLLGTA